VALSYETSEKIISAESFVTMVAGKSPALSSYFARQDLKRRIDPVTIRIVNRQPKPTIFFVAIIIIQAIIDLWW